MGFPVHDRVGGGWISLANDGGGYDYGDWGFGFTFTIEREEVVQLLWREGTLFIVGETESLGAFVEQGRL